jgi:hypothetical protein
VPVRCRFAGGAITEMRSGAHLRFASGCRVMLRRSVSGASHISVRLAAAVPRCGLAAGGDATCISCFAMSGANLRDAFDALAVSRIKIDLYQPRGAIY